MMDSAARFTLSSSLIPIAILVLFTMQLVFKGEDTAASANYLMQIQGMNDDAWQFMDSEDAPRPSASAFASIAGEWGRTGP
ncbi:hypothetical protein L4174_019590 [Photobacterium sp. CCB-ST2H9]|uniref:hypothetical protein n=1 Tax=Photobacterium sp. CCB-ST2H9 TaxID=2912855 RepID=UPI0020033E58|nr:hypothetical protein [Photobacterium sp. CCB-ST2H9]UTM60260.1 hypothetical protein L4174_019590 [Photobacterium sp. CCB-ST2H9]